MRLKSVATPKTIKIDEPTWKRLIVLKAELGRETIDDTIWYLLERNEKYDIR